jgi:HD-like signal output (HDOD) protein/CheY-like chemotaxis protein
MKKSVLFVDDEAEILAQLERELSDTSSSWETAFADSGAKALEMMKGRRFDVVVADMHMPGMNGAELLNIVGKEHGDTLRFIRSSFADKELMMTCVWGTHHFIPKPTETTEIVSTLQRALALDAWMGSDKVKELVAKVQNFPSLPSVYFEVIKQLESPNATVEQIGDAIAKDLAMTAKLLQMVNSAFFGLSQKITSPSHAVLTLGMETVRSILLCIQVYSKSDQSSSSKLSLDRLWSHSLAVATAAKRITLFQTGDEKQADEAFTAGILHDVGKLILSSNLGEAYNRVLDLARTGEEPLWQIEERELGASHADVGAYLLGRWSMPVSLLEAAAFHHHPDRCATTDFSPAVAVHAANVFAHEQQTKPEKEMLPQLDLARLEAIGLVGSVDAWREAASGKTPARIQPAAMAKTDASAPKVVPVAPPVPPQVLKSGSTNWWLWLGAPLAACIVVIGIASTFAKGRPGSHAKNAPASRPNEATDAATVDRPTPTQLAALKPPTEPIVIAETPKPEPVREPAPLPVESKPLPVAAPEPKPAPVVAVRTDYQLQGIFYGSKRPSATINGRLVFAGDRVSGAEVVSIGRSNVLLSVRGETRELKMR